MRVIGVGAGPAALYLAILLKKKDPSHSVTLFERHHPGESFGFGVVFSDATMDNLANADPVTIDRLKESFHHWDDIDVHYRGELLRSTGHGFSGIARAALLRILRTEALSLGVEIRNGVEVRSRAELPPADLIVAADGVASLLRTESAAGFGTRIDERKNRFVWLGTTRRFPAFTFYFKSNEHGLFRVHAYQYETHPVGENPCSTFIVEATDETFRRAGLSETDEAATVAYCEALFREELEGARLIPNRSIWRRFPTVVNERWHDGSMVLIGDAAHTAHFSVGSGTKLAMEDSIALAASLSRGGSIPEALTRYEQERRGPVESLQRAAQASLEWFEDTERYMNTAPIQFGFNLVTRSLRITHEDLRKRDPGYVAQIDAWYAVESETQAGVIAPLLNLTERDSRGGTRRIAPPFLTPFKMRDLVLENRIVVSSMCQYSAVDGMPDDWHLVHLGSRAIGGAGLVMAEMTDVTPEGRITPGCTGLYDDKQVKPWKRIVEFVHKNSTAKIGIQLGHAGRKGASTREWEGDEALPPDQSWDLLAPSPIAWSKAKRVPREMTAEDMAEVKGHFAAAARRARKAGFDLLELHCAHGYLLASFLSPLTNHRSDAYGGSLENRLRYPLEVFDAVRGAWPAEKPLTVRISATDWVDGGIVAEEAVAIAKAFKEHGCDLIDASAGQTVPEQRPRYGRLFQTPFADRIRHEAGIATMAVGAISSFADANTILAAGRADLVALARAHLYDPYWTRHAAQDFGVRLPWPDPYSSINAYTPRFR
ncbi:MAG: FAD-dependent monooxygenase [Vicinamibacteria bacterium]|nr:FAD-dependent monooxygenase [Vicinamibacteria bacterium]